MLGDPYSFIHKKNLQTLEVWEPLNYTNLAMSDDPSCHYEFH